jgi:hypothetical protein
MSAKFAFSGMDPDLGRRLLGVEGKTFQILMAKGAKLSRKHLSKLALTVTLVAVHAPNPIFRVAPEFGEMEQC